MPRRHLGRLALAGAGLLPWFHSIPADAAMLIDPGGDGDVPYQYALRLVDDPAAESINAHLEPDSASDVVATIPFGTPVGVLGQRPGERLAYGDGAWWEVLLPYGTGWVYGPLLGDAPQGPAAPLLPPPVPEPPKAPAPVGPGRAIVVSRDDQFLWAFEDGGVPILKVGCTTGNPRLATPLGTFAVTGHFRPYEFISPWPPGSPDWYPPSHANYALRFLGRDFYLHDASWRRVFGPESQGGDGPPGGDHTGSHGCINLPYPAARFLFFWAAEGTPVRVVGTGSPALPTVAAALPVTPALAPPSRPVIPPGVQPPAHVTYVVRPGDTLFSLARRFGVTTSALARANGLSDPRELRAGQALLLP